MKRHVRKLMIIAAVLLLSVSFTACKKDADKEKEKEEAAEVKTSQEAVQDLSAVGNEGQKTEETGNSFYRYSITSSDGEDQFGFNIPEKHAVSLLEKAEDGFRFEVATEDFDAIVSLYIPQEQLDGFPDPEFKEAGTVETADGTAVIYTQTREGEENVLREQACIPLNTGRRGDPAARSPG